MSEDTSPPRRADRILLLEVALGLLLLGLFVVLYLIPAESSFAERRWWSGPLLAAFFFGVLLLDAWRRKRRNRDALREVLRDHDRGGAV